MNLATHEAASMPNLPDEEQDREKSLILTPAQEDQYIAAAVQAFNSLSTAKDAPKYLDEYRKKQAGIDHEVVQKRIRNLLILCLSVPDRNDVKDMKFEDRWNTIVQLLARWKIVCWFVYRGRSLGAIVKDPGGALNLSFAHSVAYDHDSRTIAWVEWTEDSEEDEKGDEE